MRGAWPPCDSFTSAHDRRPRLRRQSACSYCGWTQVEAIVIKVAAIGLDPRKHLGLTLAEMEDYLISLDDKYGVSVCGEGGEYETLVLDCPMFQKRIGTSAAKSSGTMLTWGGLG